MCDYVFDIGEGDSFSDIYGINRFRSINDQHRLAHFFHKNLILLPQTIGPFYCKSVKKRALKCISNANIVFTRDFQSQQYVKENLNKVNSIESIDVAFFLPFTKKNIYEGSINVGLNISALLWNGGYTKNNQFNLNVDYKSIIHKLLIELLMIPDVKIHLVSHVVSLNSHIENDYEVNLLIANELNNPNVVLAPFFLNPVDAKSYISALDFLTGARMHACIAAYSSSVPVVPMAYSRKFNGLFIDTLNYGFVVDLVNQSEDEIIDNIKSYFCKRSELKEQIKESMDNLVAKKGEELKLYLKNILELN